MREAKPRDATERRSGVLGYGRSAKRAEKPGRRERPRVVATPTHEPHRKVRTGWKAQAQGQAGGEGRELPLPPFSLGGLIHDA